MEFHPPHQTAMKNSGFPNGTHSPPLDQTVTKIVMFVGKWA